MCYHKSEAQKWNELMWHYSASFDSITEDLEPIKERFQILMQKDDRLSGHALTSANEIHDLLTLYFQKDALPASLTKQDLAELKWHLKTISSFTNDGFYRYYENGFDYLIPSTS
jgi:hypothetical protein